jgi:hypothetical protein
VVGKWLQVNISKQLTTGCFYYEDFSSMKSKSTKVLIALFIIALFATGIILVLAQSFISGQDRSRLSYKAGIINVPARGDLQAAINNAKAGDTILVEAGATFIGPIVLPAKPTIAKEDETAWITIRTNAPDSSLPPAGTRINPSYSKFLPKIIAPGKGESALQTAAGAHHYRLIGIEFKLKDQSAVSHELIRLGDGSNEQDSLKKVPHHLVIDRCYIHGEPDTELKRGIGLNGAYTEIINSYISDCKGSGFDTQAIAGWNGPGPFKIINNYLEGAGENVMFGGSDAMIPNLIPSDIEIRKNHFFKPPSWKGKWSVKNLFELKSAQRVIIEGNVFENNWADGQNGCAILFTVRNQDGGNPWANIKDVVFRNNIVRNSDAGFNLLGEDYYQKSQEMQNVEVSNNLLENIDGHFLIISGGINIKFTHNTVMQGGNIASAHDKPTRGFVFTNNIINHNKYGVVTDGKAPGLQSIETAFPNAVFSHNILADMERTADAHLPYPENNYYPAHAAIGFMNLKDGNYRLSPTSKYRKRATDSKDFGCDFDALENAIKGVVN